MNDAVVVALITGGISLVGSVISAVMQGQLTKYRIGKLEEKVDKHNTLVERMALVEASSKSAHHRIDEIKEGH